MKKSKISKIAFLLKNPKLLLEVINLISINGFLYESGWVNSFLAKIPLDKDNEVLPWYTYPFIDFFESKLNKNLTVFEFGCGNSTKWYAKRTNSVYSVEHDPDWHKFSQQKIENEFSNAKIYFSEINTGQYSSYIQTIDMNFDIIVIDGRDRVNCVKHSLSKLKEGGVFVFDNSDRDEYNEAYQLLKENNYKRIDFWGMGPINSYKWCTSIFYKTGNFLNI